MKRRERQRRETGPALRRDATRRRWHAIGLMSGTSTDGVDAAVVRLTERGRSYSVETPGSRTLPFPAAPRQRLIARALRLEPIKGRRSATRPSLATRRTGARGWRR